MGPSSHIKAKTQSYPKQTRSTLFELKPHHTSPHLNHVRLRLLLLPRLPEPEPILKLQPTRHKLLPKRRLLRFSILPDPTTILPGQPCSLRSRPIRLQQLLLQLQLSTCSRPRSRQGHDGCRGRRCSRRLRWPQSRTWLLGVNRRCHHRFSRRRLRQEEEEETSSQGRRQQQQQHDGRRSRLHGLQLLQPQELGVSLNEGCQVVFPLFFPSRRWVRSDEKPISPSPIRSSSPVSSGAYVDKVFCLTECREGSERASCGDLKIVRYHCCDFVS